MADAIKLYCDQHISSAVVTGLRLHGIDVLTAHEAVRCGLPDPDQLQFATEEERVIITFDRDYLALDASGVQHAGIAWCHPTKYSIGQLLQMLTLLHGVFDRDDMINHVEYL